MQPKQASLFTSSALAIACAGSSAFADITSQEVWDKLQGYYAAQGLEMSATQTPTGDGLVLSNMTMTMPTGAPGDPDVTVTMSDWTLTDRGDGTVAMTWAEPMLMTLDITEMSGAAMPADDKQTGGAMSGGNDDASDKKGEDGGDSAMTSDDKMPMAGDGDGDAGEHVVVVLSLAHDSPSVVISGSTDDMTTTYGATQATLALDSVTVNDQPVGIAQFSMDIANLQSVSRLAQGTTYSVEQTGSSGAISYNLSIVDPEEGVNVQMKGQMGSHDFAMTSTLPLEMDPVDMAMNLANGFAFDGTLKTGASTSSFNIQAEGDIVTGTTASGGSDFAIAMDKGGMRLDGIATGIDYNIQGSEIPFPLNIKAAELGLGFDMPVSASETPEDFGLRLRLGDLAVDDMIWMLIDPTGGLPHDPATLIVDLAGKANWLVDIMDPANAALLEGGEDTPAELHALTLKELQVKLAGAELTGSGDFTFDNSDLETFDGVPAPDGALELKLTGGNTLLDKLIAMGLVPAEEATGIRMMMALFAQKGEGEDTLTSRIEVKPDGQVTANGQRLQ